MKNYLTALSIIILTILWVAELLVDLSFIHPFVLLAVSCFVIVAVMAVPNSYDHG